MTNTSTALMVPASGVNKGDHVCFVVCCNISCLCVFPEISYNNLGVMEELIVKMHPMRATVTKSLSPKHT